MLFKIICRKFWRLKKERRTRGIHGIINQKSESRTISILFWLTPIFSDTHTFDTFQTKGC